MIVGWRAALELSKRRALPHYGRGFTITAKCCEPDQRWREMVFRLGMLLGKVLHARYSLHAATGEIEPDLVKALEEKGAFTHHSSIAPTGTISLSLANNANGIEPSFASLLEEYNSGGEKTKEKVDVFSYELLAYRTLINPSGPGEEDSLPKLRNR